MYNICTYIIYVYIYYVFSSAYPPLKTLEVGIIYMYIYIYCTYIRCYQVHIRRWRHSSVYIYIHTHITCSQAHICSWIYIYTYIHTWYIYIYQVFASAYPPLKTLEMATKAKLTISEEVCTPLEGNDVVLIVTLHDALGVGKTEFLVNKVCARNQFLLCVCVCEWVWVGVGVGVGVGGCVCYIYMYRVCVCVYTKHSWHVTLS